MSWVGTGRCLSNMDFTPADYQEIKTKLVNAARAMRQDCWWLSEEQQPGRNRKMHRGLVREILGTLVPVPKPLRVFYAEVMRRKHDDHEGLPQLSAEPVLSHPELQRLSSTATS